MSASVPAVAATWNQDLTFTGEVSGHMSAITPNTSTLQNACTGAKPRPGQTWADEFYGTINTAGDVWGIDFLITNYGGPGVYRGQAIAIEVRDATGLNVWENQGADAVTFTLDHSQQAGTVDAMLTNADTGKAGSLHVTGHWNCIA